MNIYEIVSFAAYFIIVLGVGLYFFVKSKSNTEMDYFLGGRNMSGLVSALSAGASDMSAWVLMGLPGAIFLKGLGQVWISIGLIIGTVLAWIFVAPRLRTYSIETKAITIPEFFQKRFDSKNTTLRVSCAIIFFVGYLVYSASSIYACGDLFNSILGVDKVLAMIVAAGVILIYTLLGGFNAVCWTDFFQGMLMLVALMAVPIIMTITMNVNHIVGAVDTLSENYQYYENYYSFLSSGKWDWSSIASIITGLGWGLGYFGMPHILVRYMSIKNKKELRKSQIIGSSWTFLILLMATIFGLLAHKYLGTTLEASSKSLVFVNVVRDILGKGALAIISGIIISAVIAASMSTADSQLLASSSSFASDIYKTKINKKASDSQILKVGQIGVLLVTVFALLIAITVQKNNLGGIMELVSAAWSIFGAAFGPAILLALYWKRFNYKGAIAAIISGFGVSILWMVLFNMEYYGFKSVVFNTQVYEIVPGFIVSLLIGILVSKITEQPSQSVLDHFERVQKDEVE